MEGECGWRYQSVVVKTTESTSVHPSVAATSCWFSVEIFSTETSCSASPDDLSVRFHRQPQITHDALREAGGPASLWVVSRGSAVWSYDFPEDHLVSNIWCLSFSLCLHLCLCLLTLSVFSSLFDLFSEHLLFKGVILKLHLGFSWFNFCLVAASSAFKCKVRDRNPFVFHSEIFILVQFFLPKVES